jgi:hypothetical protein
LSARRPQRKAYTYASIMERGMAAHRCKLSNTTSKHLKSE